MPHSVGDIVDERSPTGTIPEGRYEVLKVVGERVQIRDLESRATSVVHEDDLISFNQLATDVFPK